MTKSHLDAWADISSSASSTTESGFTELSEQIAVLNCKIEAQTRFLTEHLLHATGTKPQVFLINASTDIQSMPVDGHFLTTYIRMDGNFLTTYIRFPVSLCRLF